MATEYLEANKQVQFFLIITEKHQQGQLVKPCMLPIKFVRKYGQGLPKVICLKTSNEEDWKVNLENNDGKIWFGEGWKEFAQHYSLGYGHLLVFKYQTHSEFHVDIFDTTRVEIDYPPKRVEAENVSNNEKQCRTSKKRKANSSNYDTHKKSKGKQVNTILESANEFETCNPSFVIVMGASYVEARFILSIPCDFGKRHFDLEKMKGDICLRVSDDERVWPARYTVRRIRGRIRFELTGGWRKFSMDNNLKVGDVCKFELILKTKMTLQVHIFRKTNARLSRQKNKAITHG